MKHIMQLISFDNKKLEKDEFLEKIKLIYPFFETKNKTHLNKLIALQEKKKDINSKLLFIF